MLRKFLLLLAASAPVLSSAHAQVIFGGGGAPFTCIATAPSAPTIGHSLAQIGDLFLDCGGGVPIADGAPAPQAMFTIFLNVAALSAPDPILAIDSPGTAGNPNVLVCPDPVNGCPMNGGMPGAEPYDGSTGRANEFEGIVAANTITFKGVPIDPPGSNGTLLFDFGNLWVNTTGYPNVLTSITYAISTSGTSMAIAANGVTGVLAFVSSGANAPEPSALALAVIGLSAAGWLWRRRATLADPSE